MSNWMTLEGISIIFLLYQFGVAEYVIISLLQLSFCFIVTMAKPKAMKLRSRMWDILSYYKNVCRSFRARTRTPCSLSSQSKAFIQWPVFQLVIKLSLVPRRRGKRKPPPIMRHKNIIYKSISQSRLWGGSKKMSCSRRRQQSVSLNDGRWGPHQLSLFLSWHPALKFPIYPCPWCCVHLRLFRKTSRFTSIKFKRTR